LSDVTAVWSVLTCVARAVRLPRTGARLTVVVVVGAPAKLPEKEAEAEAGTAEAFVP